MAASGNGHSGMECGAEEARRRVAVIGMACHFAESPDVEAFWENILHGRECFTAIPSDRWDNAHFYSPRGRDVDFSYVTNGGFIGDPHRFAAISFGIAPRRVQVMDPQQRLVLETVRQALLDAGLEDIVHRPGERVGAFDPRRTGTFLGVSASEHRDVVAVRSQALTMAMGGFGQRPDAAGRQAILEAVNRLAPINAFSIAGTLLNMNAANVAQYWGFNGPAVSIDAACASALVAVHDAVLHIRSGNCDGAIAGGVYLNFSPVNQIGFSRIGAISRQGRCRAFDAEADGFVQGEGCGIVVLKRLDLALADGDRIYGVIRGVGCNNDGDRASGPMAPSQEGQIEVIEQALRDGGLQPEMVDFVECHGTSTPVGDPVEVEALQGVYGRTVPSSRPLQISSVKANVGHTMSAAGIAGLIKALLVLDREVVPPQAAFERANEKLNLEGFEIARAAQPWPHGETPRFAAVSSFGFGGTNAHVIVEEAPRAAWAATREVDAYVPVVISAESQAALTQHAAEVAAWLESGPGASLLLADVAYTLSATRQWGPHRVALAVRSVAELGAGLRLFAEKGAGLSGRGGRLSPNVFWAALPHGAAAPRVAFMFPGQGAQRVGLLRAFCGRYRRFSEPLAAYLAAAQPLATTPLLEALYPAADVPAAEAETRLAATEVCQPVMAAVGLALLRLLADLGVEPVATFGHSLGEFVALAAAGGLAPEDAVRFVTQRGRLMADLAQDDLGAMAAVMLDRAATAEAIATLPGVVVANCNAPKQTVISGSSAGVQQAVEALTAAQIVAKPLRVSHAFHSPLIAAVEAPLAEVIDALPLQACGVPLWSAVTAAPYPSDVAEMRGVMRRHATAAVDFIGVMERVRDEGIEVFLEVGAGQTLTSFAKGTLGGEQMALSLCAAKDDEDLEFARTLAQLAVAGVDLRLRRLFDAFGARVVSLPLAPQASDTYSVITDKAMTPHVAGMENQEMPNTPAEKPSETAAPVSTAAMATAPAPVVPAPEMSDQVVALLREQTALMQAQLALLQGRPVPRGAAPLTVVGLTPAAAAAAPVAAQAAVPAPALEAAPAPAPAVAAPSAATFEASPGGGGLSPEELAAQVMAAVSAVSAFPEDALRPEQKLATDLGFDSLMFVDLATRVQDAFPELGGIPQTLLSERTSVGDIIAHLQEQLASTGGAEKKKSDAKLSQPLAQLGLRPRGMVGLPGGPMLPGTCWVVAAEHAVGEGVAHGLAARGVEVCLVRLGAPFGGLVADGAVQSCAWPASPEALWDLPAALLREGVASPKGLLFIPSAPVADGLEVALGTGWLDPTAQALALSAPLRGCGIDVSTWRILTMSGGALGLGAQGSVALTALQGFALALAREWPAVQVQVVDVAPGSAEVGAGHLLAELGDGNDDVLVAYGGDGRRVLDVIPLAAGGEAAPWVAQGALITGGGRGLGAKVAVALAERGVARLLLVGATPLADSAAARETLAAVQAAGAQAHYVAWDLNEAVPEAFLAAVAELGPMELVVHAAGVLRDKRVESKTLADLRQVMGIKVLGLAQVLAALPGEALRRVVTFSSWAAHLGNIGQTDYAAANLMMERYAEGWAAERPGVTALSLRWPLWESSGMAATIPGVVKRAMQGQGIPFLSDDEGLASFMASLDAGHHGTVLVGAVPGPAHLPVERHFSLAVDAHRYLADHQVQGRPVLPFAMAMEFFAAVHQRFWAGQTLCIEEMSLYQGVEAPCEVRLQATPQEDGSVAVTLHTQRGEGGWGLAYKARLRPGAGEAPRAALAPLAVPVTPAMSIGDFYRDVTFHGPIMQALRDLSGIGDEGIDGSVGGSRPAQWLAQPWRAAWLVDPMQVDGAFQLVAYHLAARFNQAAYPVSLARCWWRGAAPGETVRCQVRGGPDGQGNFVGEIAFLGAEGEVIGVLQEVRGRVYTRGAKVGDGGGATQRVRSRARAAKEVEAGAVDAKFYRVERFPEVRSLTQRLEMAQVMGLRNPYFGVNEGTAGNRTQVGGRDLINFSSYNYLGLSGRPEVNQAAKDAIDRYGTSVSASRVASGERPFHGALERLLAQVHGVEDAVVFSAGHATNESVIGHLFGEGDLIVHDALAHNSIQQGAILSGAKRRPFPHNDPVALDKLLTQIRGSFRRVCIAIEGVYSMDGDLADLPAFIALRNKHACLLYVDEAHSIGVLGASGRGIGEHFGVDTTEVDVWMGTLSKAFASCGGYVAGRRVLTDYIRYTAPAFVFSAGITPANANAALEAVQTMLAEPALVARLQRQSARFLARAKSRGIDTGLSAGSAVVPCIVGDSYRCLQLSERLDERGINVQPIVYPAVDDNESRLRFFISALHTDEEIDHSVDILADELAALSTAT